MRPKVIHYVAMESSSSLVWCGESQSEVRGVFRMNTQEAGSEESHNCLLRCNEISDVAPTVFAWNRRQTMIAVVCGGSVLIAEWRAAGDADEVAGFNCRQHILLSEDAPVNINHVAFCCVDDQNEGVFFATTSELFFSSVEFATASDLNVTSPKARTSLVPSSPLLCLCNDPTPTQDHRCFAVYEDLGVVGVRLVAGPAPASDDDGTTPPQTYELIGSSPVPFRGVGLETGGLVRSCGAGPYQSQLLVTDNALVALQCRWEGDAVHSEAHHVPLSIISARGGKLHLAVWDPWSKNPGTCAAGFWTLDQCFCVHHLCLDGASGVSGNHLIGEVSPFSDEHHRGDTADDVVWCGALGAGKTLTIARRLAGFIGLEALYEENQSKAGSVTPAPESEKMAMVTSNTVDELDGSAMPRQASEDTVMVADDDAQLADIAAEGQDVSAVEAAAVIATEDPVSQGEAGSRTSPADEPQQVTSQPPPLSVTPPQQLDTPAAGAETAKPPPESKPKIRRRAATPPLPEADKKPAVPRLAEKLRQEKRVLAATRKPRGSQSSAQQQESHGAGGSSFAGPSGAESRESLPPRGPGVPMSVDTADLADHRDAMDVYILTKLLGEGWETPVVFVPITATFRLTDLRSKLEEIHGRRLSIAFATPAGKLIELRPSTIKIFQSYDDDSKQIYCRGLFPKIESALPSEMNSRAHSALETESTRRAQLDPLAPRAATPQFPDVSAISHRSGHLSESTVLLPTRKLTKEEQTTVSRRLHETSVEMSKTKLASLEKKFWPTELGAKKIAADATTDMVDRLYRKSNEVKEKKLVELQKAVDIQTFGSKPPLQLPDDERKVIAEKFYDMGVKQVQKLEALAVQRAHPRAVSPKLSTPEEWAAWQQSMARPIGKRFKSKDPYIDPS